MITRWSAASTAILALALVATTACSRRQPETEARPRTETPAAMEDTSADEGTADTGMITREEAMTSIGEMIFFDFDRSELRTEARETLQRKSEVLRQYPEIAVRIEGHADERGTVEYNLALGERRAETARAYLIDLGIDADRLTTVSYGEERPLVPESNEAAWQQNRRDEFIPVGG